MWDSLVWASGIDCVLCVGDFCVGLWERVCAVCAKVWCGFVGESLCCVWESFVWVCGSECVLCLRQIGVGLWERVCAVFGRVSCGFLGVSV